MAVADGESSGRSLLRQVALPNEHGAWAFLAEPVALGLLLSFSTAGLLLSLAAAAAFLARRPFRILFTDRRAGTRHARTPAAERVFAGCAAAGALALAGALLHARGQILLPLGLAAPIAATALAFDLGQRSRELAAEVAGALALAAVASAIVLAGGWSMAPALALWAFLAARIAPSILYVRARLRLERGAPSHVAWALVAHVIAVGLAALLARYRLVPWLGVAALTLLALRAAWGLSSFRPAMKTWQLGVSEIVFGAVTVLAMAGGVAWGM